MTPENPIPELLKTACDRWYAMTGTPAEGYGDLSTVREDLETGRALDPPAKVYWGGPILRDGDSENDKLPLSPELKAQIAEFNRKINQRWG